MKNILIILTILTASFTSYADLEKAPPSFTYETKKAVWVNFISADYKIIFDLEKKKAKSITEIQFKTTEEGYPIFDSVNEIDKIYLDGNLVSQNLISTPNQETMVRLINIKLRPGKYHMTIYSNIESGISFDNKKVSAGFFMKDMKDREFLEKYLPSNLEYDQYKMKLNVLIKGSDESHKLFTNGNITTINKNHFQVTYPEFYNSSSLYFHLVPSKKFKIRNSVFKSIDGRSIPVTIYSKYKSLNSLVKRKIHKILKELEHDYGPWPHPQVILYSNSKLRGGMEYAGAAVSGWLAIGHELQHAYFARAVMPKNGNSGWLDEGIASWRDFFHRRSSEPNFSSSNIGGKGPYIRKTDLTSYKKGRSFMRYLDHLIHEETEYCLKDFLKFYFNKRKYTTVDTNIFISDLESFTGVNFQRAFDQYIFGVTGKEEKEHNPYHLNLSEKELQELI